MTLPSPLPQEFLASLPEAARLYALHIEALNAQGAEKGTEGIID